MLLFFSHFSSRKPVCNEKTITVGYIIDRFVDAVDRHFSYSPLLNYGYHNLIAFRNTWGKVL
jgi:hypothetical protein